MSRFLLASLIVLASSAQAGPAARPPVSPPAPSPTCAATGQPLVSIVRRTDDPNHAATPRVDSTFAITTTGAWTYTQLDAKGARAREANGCLDAKQLASMRRELDRATWKVERAEMTCQAISMSYTEYYVHGKLRWTARLCQPEHLDARTAKTLADLEQLATGLEQPGAIEPSPGTP